MEKVELQKAIYGRSVLAGTDFMVTIAVILESIKSN
jgi:hypothetical protein